MRASLVAQLNPKVTRVTFEWNWRTLGRDDQFEICSTVGNPETCKRTMAEYALRLYPWTVHLMLPKTRAELDLT